MRRSLTAISSAAALALALGSGMPVLAQAQLEDEAVMTLEGMGFDVDTAELTEEQVLEITNVLNSDQSEDEKKMAIEALFPE